MPPPLSADWHTPCRDWTTCWPLVAVGLWSAVALPQRRWQAPAVFVAAMALGACWRTWGCTALGGALEVMIAASVVLLGALLVSGAALPAGLGLGLVGASALLHGTAHGLEMAAALPFWPMARALCWPRRRCTLAAWAWACCCSVCRRCCRARQEP